MSFALSFTWILGWAIGVVVVIIAAALLLAIIALGRRIATQAQEITTALDGARANTDALFEVKSTNLAIDRITRGLNAARGGSSPPAEESAVTRATSRISRALHRGDGPETE